MRSIGAMRTGLPARTLGVSPANPSNERQDQPIFTQPVPQPDNADGVAPEAFRLNAGRLADGVFTPGTCRDARNLLSSARVFGRIPHELVQRLRRQRWCPRFTGVQRCLGPEG